MPALYAVRRHHPKRRCQRQSPATISFASRASLALENCSILMQFFAGFRVLKAILTQINPGLVDTSNLPAGK
jgi:hypothetical protein